MSDAWQFLSRAERFRLKAGQCRSIAETARLAQTKVIFTNLARSYGRLAAHEESLEAAIRRSASDSLKQASWPNAARSSARQDIYVDKGGLEASQSRTSEHHLARLLAGAGAAYNFLYSAFGGYGERYPGRRFAEVGFRERVPTRARLASSIEQRRSRG
jgi:hypothetical protein